MKTLIKNGTVVTASDTYKADVLIEDEKVAMIGSNLPAGDAEVIDAEGLLLMPGGNRCSYATSICPSAEQ